MLIVEPAQSGWQATDNELTQIPTRAAQAPLASHSMRCHPMSGYTRGN